MGSGTAAAFRFIVESSIGVSCEDHVAGPVDGTVVTVAKIIKFVMSSAAEADMGALYETAKELVPIRLTLEEMGWKQPITPIQTDNTTAAGVVNNTIIPKKSKSMDLRFWWLKCRESQQQFRYYWVPGRNNWGDYSTKHHPPIYHEENRARCAGISKENQAKCNGISKGTINAARFPLPVPFEKNV